MSLSTYVSKYLQMHISKYTRSMDTLDYLLLKTTNNLNVSNFMQSCYVLNLA